MSQITVISGPERRRVWNDQQKHELVAAVSAPGANMAEIVRVLIFGRTRSTGGGDR
ncbi:hypothetical protein TomTYG75_28090 [Sphingobium sp. TomTYG75]